MVGSPTRRKRRQTLISYLAEPPTLERLCSDLASGLTLAEWCRKNDAPYHEVHTWVHGNPARLRAYAQALEVRSASLTDRFTAGVRTLVDADPRRAFRQSGRGKGTMLGVPDLPDDVAMALDGIDTTYAKDGTPTTKLRMVPKGRAYELLGRHLGAFRDKLDVDLKVGMADRLRAARQRALTSK